MFNWTELAFAGIFALVFIGVNHLVFHLLISRARSTMGIAAGPRVAALTKQRGLAMTLAAILPATLTFGFFHGATGGKQPEWQIYTSDRGAYVADMPGVPVFTQKEQPMPNGGPTTIYSAAVDLGGNGSFAVLELDGPKLTYETGDRSELSNANNSMVFNLQATPDQTAYPYPTAWGEVPCAETRGHLNKDPQQVLIIRSWRTGTHTYAALAGYRLGTASEATAHRFLDSIRPVDGYQKPGPNHT